MLQGSEQFCRQLRNEKRSKQREENSILPEKNAYIQGLVCSGIRGQKISSGKSEEALGLKISAQKWTKR